MKPHQYLTILISLFSFANSFPQNLNPSSRSIVNLASAPEDPEYFAVVARTITVDDNTVTVGHFTVGKPGDAGPATAFAGETADLRTPETTTAPTVTAAEPSKPDKATAAKPIPTIPFNAACPVPSSFTINNFVSVSGKGGHISFIITYGNGTVSCEQPWSPLTYDMTCGAAASVHVQTDGSSWIMINEKYNCSNATRSNGNLATVASGTNYTTFRASLFCDTDDAAVQTCLQLNPNIEMPVSNYDTAGSIARK